MKCRERILTALNNDQPDKVPIFDFGFSSSIIVKLAKLLMPEAVKVQAGTDISGALLGVSSVSSQGPLDTLDLYCLLVDRLGLDATSISMSLGIEPIGEGIARDKYGTVYHLSEHGEPMPVEGPIKEPSDIAGFDVVSKLRVDDFASTRYVIDKVGKDKAHFVVIPDPFKTSWYWRGGMQNLLIDFILNPQLVHDLARIATDLDIAAIDMAVEVGADVVVLAGDLAGERTLFMSPEHHREYIKPYHKEIVDYAHKKGVKIVKHCDGDHWPILDDFVEVGFDGIHPIQPQCMDIEEVKNHLAGKACILGNIDCRDLLPFGTEEEVEKAVNETIEKAAPGGGYIICSSNSIHPGCKPENYVAMVNAAHKYGVYNTPMTTAPSQIVS